MRLLSFFVLLALLTNPVLAQRGNPAIEYDGRSVDQLIADFMRDNDVPGMSLAIVQAPYITRCTNYGVSDISTRQLVAGHTLFNVAEMAEAYTAVAVMQLVEQGKLKLDDPVEKFVPALPPGFGKLTVLQLLRHQSGLPEVGEEQDLTNWLVAQKPRFAPGEKLVRCATDHWLLQVVVEAASKQSYQEFVRTNQFQRLGLRQTYFASELADIQREHLAPGQRHQQFLHQPGLIDPTEPARGNPDAPDQVTLPQKSAIFASASDISVWDIGLAGDILIKDPQLRKLLYAPGQLSDGAAIASSGPWDFPGWPGLMVVTGHSRGYSSLLSRFTDPKDLLCVTLLANKEGLDLTQLARKIAGAYDSRLGPPLSTSAMRVHQSPHSVTETMVRLEKALTGKGVQILSRVDHAKGAKGVNLELPATYELIFGNPAAGTRLMQSNRAVAVDLPLRAVAWEENGAVWLAATDPVEICRRHGLEEHEKLALEMRHGLDRALAEAVRP